jgi:hypothetical protein
MDFAAIANDLAEAVQMAGPLLRQVGNTEASFASAPGKWTKKEILAHLIDSASNNHQRFVRAAAQGSLEFPAYDQDKLIAVQKPNNMSWELLIEFWSGYNRYLVHVLNQIPAPSAEVQCSIGGKPPVTLLWLAGDYVEHLKHHLNQIVGKRFESAWTMTASR